MPPRITPLDRKDLPEFESAFQGMIDSIGYVPNSFFTMGRAPLLLKAVDAMSDAAWYPTTVEEPVRRLVTFAFSQFSQSHYSAAHCACGAPELGLPLEKILAIHAYETSPLYDQRERALLRLCRHAARIPGEVTDQDVNDLKQFFSDEQVIFITTLICYMAFLNKWNEIIGTRLEDIPHEWSKANLQPVGWKPGH